MKRKWPTVMVSSIALAGILFSTSGISYTEASSTVKTDLRSSTTVKAPLGIVKGEVEGKAKVKIKKNGNVKLNYKVKNQTEKVVSYTFPSGLTVDYIVYDSEGKKFTQFSDQVSSTLAIEEMSLKQGEEYQENFIIEGLPNGKYTIDVFLNAKEDQAMTSKKFTVKKSVYNRTKGTLISWNDKANTVQVMLGKKPTSFQMTDSVKEQLLPIEKGQEMDFVYSDTKIELKTIERIIVAPKKVTLKHSVLEIDKELKAMFEHIKKNKNLTALEGYQPFEVFSTYMYSQAGEDYETLYSFYKPGNLDMKVEDFKKKYRSDENTALNRSFMKKLNSVREYTVEVRENEVIVSFNLEKNENMSFVMAKYNNTWYAVSMPLSMK
ncbi:BsuPI-related putative proteinase inhibitor [Peribacillus alkalitolerans]|uniref:BsuPI-related putative proteinase inhibitor n=1 Tax=Peribacillus alkalitolerans TaxID=1550385 RepID=UPI0013CF6156|nr:BsuPI-related putative proteinase inhibitor [Peribacillus alkalitolerans]